MMQENYSMPIRILHLEDESEDKELVKEALNVSGLNCEIRYAENELSFVEGLEGFQPDVILADYNLPLFNGISALNLTLRNYPEIPFIFVTGALGEEMAVKILKLGATDFILKNNLIRLMPAITRALKEKATEKEKKKLYKDLIESEERYRTLVENLPVGIFRTTLENPGRFLHVNKAAVMMLGFESPDQLLNLSAAEIYELPEERVKSVEQILKEGSITKSISALKKKNGDRIYASISASLSSNETGDPECIEGIIEDVTEKLEADEKIRAYTNFLEILIDTSSNPVFYKDSAGVYLGCNKSFAERIVGLPREQIVGKTVVELESRLTGDMVKNYDLKDRELLQNPGQQEYESKVHCADGIVRDYHFSKSTFPGPDGEIAGIVGIMFDVSERVHIENDLRRINEEYDLLIMSMPSIIIEVSVKDRVRQINPYTEKLFGIRSEDVLNRRFYECGIKWDWESIYEAIGTCMFEEVVVRLDELRFTRPDGREGILGLTLNPLIRSGTLIEGFIILGKDLTEQKILEGQLLQSRKLEAIGQLAAGVAHEINTPLQYVGDNLKFISKSFTGISGVLELYLKQLPGVCTDEERDRLSRQISVSIANIRLPFLLEQTPLAIAQSLEGVARVSAIVQSMKAFSHPGLGSKQPADINRSIENTVQVSRNEWKYDAEVILELDETLPPVPCLESEFNQVILNLIINSVDAIQEARSKGKTENGIIRITTAQDSDYAVITVEDNGTGIPKEIRDRIFDPFFTTKEVGKGTGQGLAISYNVIVEKHGGTMYVDSEQGKRTVFTVKLPKKEDNA